MTTAVTGDSAGSQSMAVTGAEAQIAALNEILGREASYAFFSNTRPDSNGFSGINAGSDGWQYVGAQRQGMIALAYAAARGDEEGVATQWRGMTAAFGQQLNSGEFSHVELIDGLDVSAPFYTTSFLVEAANALLVLQSSSLAPLYQDRIDALLPAIEKAAEFVATPGAIKTMMSYDGHAANRLATDAGALILTGVLVSNTALIETGRSLLNHLSSLQYANGVLPENGGHDVSYQGVSISILTTVSFYDPDNTTLTTMLQRAVDWELSRVQADGTFDREGDTRTNGQETWLDEVKGIDYRMVVGGLALYGAAYDNGTASTDATNIYVQATGDKSVLNVLPTGELLIGGTALQGQVLTASAATLADANGLGMISYQWQRDDGAGNFAGISGATGTAYTLSQADVGHSLRLLASYTDSLGAKERVYSAATEVVANLNDLPTGAPGLSGISRQGYTLTASQGRLADADGLGAISYQWQRDDGAGNFASIAGATGTAYTLSQADVGHRLQVVASYTDGLGTRESVGSVVTSVISNANDLPTGELLVGGTALQGRVLTASAATLADIDGLGMISYQWQRDDGAGNFAGISGATGTAYTLSQADVGHSLRLLASYTDGLGAKERVYSAATEVVANLNDLPTGAPGLSGISRQGYTLTASQGRLADADGLGAISYQWQRDDGAGNFASIAGATGTAYTLSQADVGHRLQVVASYTDGLGTRESVGSVVTSVISNANDLPTGELLVGGTALQGRVLTASAATLADIDGLGMISYQWQRDDGAGNFTGISGATGTAYTLSQADVGHSLRLLASYTDGLGAKERVYSAATESVAATHGTAQPGDEPIAASYAAPSNDYVL
jgi:hypothetical protein